MLPDYPGHSAKILDMKILHNEGLIATCGLDATIRYWRPDTGRQILMTTIPRRDFSAAAFSNTGRFVATGHSDGVTRVWDIETRKETRSLLGAPGFSGTISWSPGDKVVWSISSGADEITDAWILDSPQRDHRFLGPLRGIRSVAYSPVGARFALARSDGLILYMHI